MNHEPCTYSQRRMTPTPPGKHPPSPEKNHPVGMIRNICTRKATFLVFCSLKTALPNQVQKVKKKKKERGKYKKKKKNKDERHRRQRNTDGEKINNKNIAFCSKDAENEGDLF